MFDDVSTHNQYPILEFDIKGAITFHVASFTNQLLWESYTLSLSDNASAFPYFNSLLISKSSHNHVSCDKPSIGDFDCLLTCGYNTMLLGGINASLSTTAPSPVICDSNASSTIRGFKYYSIGLIIKPIKELCLGGMTDVILIEGTGKMLYTLQTDTTYMGIRIYRYYIPSTKEFTSLY